MEPVTSDSDNCPVSEIDFLSPELVPREGQGSQGGMATLCNQCPSILGPSLLSVAPARKAPWDQEEGLAQALFRSTGLTGRAWSTIAHQGCLGVVEDNKTSFL